MGVPYRDGPPVDPFPRALGAPPERWLADRVLSVGVGVSIVLAALVSATAKDAWPWRFHYGDGGPGFAMTTILAIALAAAVGAALGRGSPAWAFASTGLLGLGAGFGHWAQSHAPHLRVMLEENPFGATSLIVLALLLAGVAAAHAAFGRARTWEDGDRLRLALAAVLGLAAFYLACVGVFGGPEPAGERTPLFALTASLAMGAGVLFALGLRGLAARRRFVARARAGIVAGWTVGWREGRRDLGLPHLWPGADEGAKILSGPGGDVAVVP